MLVPGGAPVGFVADEDVLCCVESFALDADEPTMGAEDDALLSWYVVDVPVLADVLRSSAAVLPAVGALFGVP